MKRHVQTEILDHLPACNLDAIASRRDLHKINCLMGNFRWIASAFHSKKNLVNKRYLEIGAGDGTLAMRLLKILPEETLDAIDLSSKPEAWPVHAQWIQQDLLSFNQYDSYTDLIANLILHHFDSQEIATLGKRIQNSRIERIHACEPCRRVWHKWQLRAGKWIGFNHVTLHDGSVSVEAGFRHNELPELLGLSKSDWNWKITETVMGAYRMQATRI